MNQFFSHLKCGNQVRLREQLAGCERGFAALGDDCRAQGRDGAFGYWLSISTCAQMGYWWHFGFRGNLVPAEIIKKGVEMGLCYFRVVGDDLGATSEASKPVAWFEPYSEVLLMATLGSYAMERKVLSDYLRPSLVVETLPIPIEPALGDVLLCVAASFQPSPMDTASLGERLRKCRKQRPKLLLKAWQALQEGDRPMFIAALVDSTANFAKTAADDDRPLTAVAVQESILAALAYERGWTDLSFDLPIAARLVTHQSLGLA